MLSILLASWFQSKSSFLFGQLVDSKKIDIFVALESRWCRKVQMLLLLTNFKFQTNLSLGLTSSIKVKVAKTLLLEKIRSTKLSFFSALHFYLTTNIRIVCDMDSICFLKTSSTKTTDYFHFSRCQFKTL